MKKSYLKKISSLIVVLLFSSTVAASGIVTDNIEGNTPDKYMYETDLFDSEAGELIKEISSCSPSASLEAIDYDGDGDMDYIEGSNEFVFIVTNADGLFEKTMVYNWLYHPDPGNSINMLVYGDITSGDFNNDGQQDFITGGINGRIRIFVNNDSQPGIPRFNSFSVAKFGQSAYGLTAADFNDDGWLDFAVSWATNPLGNSSITIFYNQGNLTFTQKDIYSIFEHYIRDLESGDFDNDGDIDVMFAYTEYKWHGDWPLNLIGVYCLLENEGDDLFGPEKVIAERGQDLYLYFGLSFYLTIQVRIRHFFGLNRYNPSLTSADYDDDGDLDFLVGDNSGNVEFFINDGQGNFVSEGVIHRYGSLSWGLASADFDGDGDIDFIVGALVEYQSDFGYVWLKQNQRNPSFTV